MKNVNVRNYSEKLHLPVSEVYKSVDLLLRIVFATTHNLQPWSNQHQRNPWLEGQSYSIGRLWLKETQKVVRFHRIANLGIYSKSEFFGGHPLSTYLALFIPLITHSEKEISSSFISFFFEKHMVNCISKAVYISSFRKLKRTRPLSLSLSRNSREYLLAISEFRQKVCWHLYQFLPVCKTNSVM